MADVNPWILLHHVGVFPVLVLSSEEARTLTADDLVLLAELGATDAMIGDLRLLALTPGRALRLDFAAQRVTIEPPDA
jgi:hypothetical protein